MLYKKIFINDRYLKLLLIFYFSFFSFKNFMKGCEEICDCCPDCCKKYWNKYFNKNKQEREIIQEEEEEKENYKEEKNITPKNFTPDKTLKKLKTNWKTYLLVIFKTIIVIMEIYMKKGFRISVKNTTLKLFLNF